jgi:hypothetical protein
MGKLALLRTLHVLKSRYSNQPHEGTDSRITASNRRQRSLNNERICRAIKQEGCPVCRLCSAGLESGWFWFFSESYAEGSGVNKYIDHWGFCNEHTKMIAKIGPKWQKSVIYSWIISSHLPNLERLQRTHLKFVQARNAIARRAARRSVDKVVLEIVPTGDCLFCESSLHAAQRHIAELLEALNDVEIRRLYENSDGLCMRHFFEAIGNLDSRHSAHLIGIIEKQIRDLRHLRDNFEEFFRKEDYRYSDEPKGDEQTTWIRSMSKFLGRNAHSDR